MRPLETRVKYAHGRVSTVMGDGADRDEMQANGRWIAATNAVPLEDML